MCNLAVSKSYTKKICNDAKNLNLNNTPFPTFPQGGRSRQHRPRLFPLGGNGKGGKNKEDTVIHDTIIFVIN